MTRKPFSHKTEKVKDVLGLIHTDVCGPLRHVSKNCASYFITFTGDYSRYGYVYLLKHKHEVFETFKVFKNVVENQLGKTIKAIRSDRGGEYISQEFNDYLKAYGIVQQLTPPYTPQHNGVSGRQSAARILNMVPTKKVDKTLYELWLGKVPNLSYLRDTKETMGYYFYYPPENKIVVERYANFLEKDFIHQKESGRNVELDDEDILPSENTSEHPFEEESLAPIVSQEEDVVPVCRSVMTHKAPNRLCLNVEIDPDRLSFNIEVEEHSLGDLNEPANYKAALSDPEFKKWLVAMNEEMQSMNDNKVWKLVVLLPKAKVVKSKWIYKKKTYIDGKVYIYKARLVAKGFTQTYRVDYEETFLPVADIRAIRILKAIAAYYDYEIWKMNIKTAFLNGFLEEEIYMEQPEGFIDHNHPRKVCKLQRSIYGLKQASRSWNKRFDEEIKKFGFHQNLNEPCVYQKASGSNVIFLILYVDDIILMGNHIPSLQEVKDYLGSIMYVVRCTRPDVAFTQNITSRFQQNPGEAHWTAVKNILKYLRNTKDTFLVYGGNPEAELQVKFVWKSSKQSTTAQHATEAEYIVASEATKEAV
ncbi:retrotransposon protein, putative, ty1-copia subclass [Tanacetum coccineum]